MVSFDHINHFDPAQETYFEQRIAQSMADELGMKASAYKLWKSQNGTCPVCQQPVTSENGWQMSKWHVHHITPKAEGGKDTVSNLVILHPNCHRQVHSQKLKVVKPAPVKRGLVEA